MATLTGRNAKVMKGSTTLSEMGTWGINITIDAIDTTSFGSTWKKTDRGMTGWEGTASGYLDKADTSGQVALETAAFSGTLVTDLKFYIDTSTYYAPSASSADAGVYLTGYNIGQDKAGVATVEFTFSGVGILKKT